jgi:hypothetical protein
MTLAAAGVIGSDDPPGPETNPVCYDCFWEYQDPEFRKELVEFYKNFETADPLIRAELIYLVSRVEGDPNGLCRSFRLLETLAISEKNQPRTLHVAEALAFTANECDRAPGPHFERASKLARTAGDEVKAEVYQAMAEDRFRPEFAETAIRTKIAAPPGTLAYVLGESAIHVRPDWKIGVQIERTVRDWLSYQMTHDFSGSPAKAADLLGYHEGARLGEIVEASDVEVEPLSGTLAARSGSRWFAADEKGIFRFEVLTDKIQYPTTRATGNLALLVDTHGLSAVVSPALRTGVDLVIGCGDHPSKMKAAFYLAQADVDGYFPCDHFVAELVGYDAPGILVGSAPVRSTEGGTVIGGQPVVFRADEMVVVQDTDLRGALQYYDAPARYFRRLSELLPLRVATVSVDDAGQAARVTGKAVEAGATAIAVRVWTEEDYAAVREWLAKSPKNRAVLFHSAPYPEGNRLFHEFPAQTTFGDPHPRFLTELPQS